MIKKLLLTTLFVFTFINNLKVVRANENTVIINALNYLKANQDDQGKITGFGGESQWAAIAFSAHCLNVADIKNPSISLKDFLENDQPATSAAATEWERRILAINAIDQDPVNFGKVDYLTALINLADQNQIGAPSLLNDDVFGLLSLVASQASSSSQIKQNTLNFILSHQNSDGGFGWSTDPSFNNSDSNDTAAAIQAIQAAKQDSLTHQNLETAITLAKHYLLSTQNSDGGFGYDQNSHSDGSSTAWALMALNVLSLQNSLEAQKAKNWLYTNQQPDGGFAWMNSFNSDTYTTSHSLIALSGSGWILNTACPPSSEPTITLLPSPSQQPSFEIKPSPSSSAQINPFPSPDATATVTAITNNSQSTFFDLKPKTNPQKILGSSTSSTSSSIIQTKLTNNTRLLTVKTMLFLLSALSFTAAVLYWLKIKK